MARQYYDDFSKLTLDKMSQSISDMTYQYKETRVPKKHYKEMLSKGYEEIVEASVSINLVNTVHSTLASLQKESPKLFYQALLLLDTGVKPSTIAPDEYQAMEHVWSVREANKSKQMLDPKYLELFKATKENGLQFTLNPKEDDK